MDNDKEIEAIAKYAKADITEVMACAEKNDCYDINKLFCKCKICLRVVFVESSYCPHCKAIGRLVNPKNQPLKKQKSPLRNAPCPCGSGKKFKKCHGG